MNRNRPQRTSSPRHVKRLLSLTAVAIISAAAALLLPLIPTEGTQAQLSTLVRVSPKSQTVTVGTDIVIDIFVDDVVGLGAYEFELAFPPDIASFVSVTNGPFLGSTGRSVICQPPLLGGGTVRFGCNTEEPPPRDMPTGSGLLATVRLSTFSCGSGTLNFIRALLSDAKGDSIPTNRQNGSFSIICPTATPTATALPPPTPGVTPEPTATPTATALATATPGVTPEPTATHTWTPEATWTQVSTWTPVATWTPEATWTPAVVAGPTHTPAPPPATATVVPLPTFGTPAATATSAPANTATPTPVIPPTATPLPGAPPSTATPPLTTEPTSTVPTPTPTSTPTLVQAIAPAVRTPVDGLPDTGGPDESSIGWPSPLLAIVSLSGGVALLAWSQLLKRRRRGDVTPAAFQPQFRPATTRRQEQLNGPR